MAEDPPQDSAAGTTSDLFSGVLLFLAAHDVNQNGRTEPGNAGGRKNGQIRIRVPKLFLNSETFDELRFGCDSTFGLGKILGSFFREEGKKIRREWGQAFTFAL